MCQNLNQQQELGPCSFARSNRFWSTTRRADSTTLSGCTQPTVPRAVERPKKREKDPVLVGTYGMGDMGVVQPLYSYIYLGCGIQLVARSMLRSRPEDGAAANPWATGRRTDPARSGSERLLLLRQLLDLQRPGSRHRWLAQICSGQCKWQGLAAGIHFECVLHVPKDSECGLSLLVSSPRRGKHLLQAVEATLLMQDRSFRRLEGPITTLKDPSPHITTAALGRGGPWHSVCPLGLSTGCPMLLLHLLCFG